MRAQAQWAPWSRNGSMCVPHYEYIKITPLILDWCQKIIYIWVPNEYRSDLSTTNNIYTSYLITTMNVVGCTLKKLDIRSNLFSTNAQHTPPATPAKISWYCTKQNDALARASAFWSVFLNFISIPNTSRTPSGCTIGLMSSVCVVRSACRPPCVCIIGLTESPMIRLLEKVVKCWCLLNLYQKVCHEH